MSELRLSVVRDDCFPNWQCGVDSIDGLVRSAFARTLFKQGLAYDIQVDGRAVGSCMVRFVRLLDEGAEYYERDREFIALEISYLAIDRRLQRRGIGTRVLKMLIQMAQRIAASLPVRFLVIDAFPEKEAWYTGAGFRTYPKVEDLRYPDTVPMRMDLIDLEAAERYAESY